MATISIWHWLIVSIFIYLIFFDWRWIYDWLLIDRFVKKSNFRRWRINEFCSRFSSERKNREKAAQLSHEQLAWALILSDHRPTAKKIIYEEFVRRRITSASVAGWLPRSIHISSLRTARSAPSLEVYQRLVKVRKFWLSVVRILSIIVLPIVPVFLLDKLANSQILAIPPLVTFVSFVGVCIIFGILTIALCVVTFGRGRNFRIILLRPFGNNDLSRPLKKMVPREIGAWGTVYTLSDKSYVPSIYLRIVERISDLGSYPLGLLLKPSRRIGIVRNERTFLNLSRALCRTNRPSLKTFLVGDQALNIKTAEECWHLVVDMLLHSSELIVMDLSQVGPGSAWEINQLRRRGLFSKCIFIAQDEYTTAATVALEKQIGDTMFVQIHLYSRESLFVDIDSFREQFSKLVTNELESERILRIV